MNAGKEADIVFLKGSFQITQNLDFSNTMFIYQKSLSLVEQGAPLVFDFSRLESFNSAGLALVVEWIKLARQLQKPIRFLHLPEVAMELAKAAGMAEMLGEFATYTESFPNL